jgi:hypothetical protein
MRFSDFNASAKVTAANATVTFSGTDIPANGVIAYHFQLTGAGMTFGDITRFRIKSQGTTVFDVDNAHLTAWIQRYSDVNRLMVAADTVWSMWLNLPDLENEDVADQSQMPRGGAPTIELQIGAGGAAGTVLCGYTVTDQAPKLYPVFYGSALQFPAGPSANSRYGFSEPGGVKGFGLNTTGLTRAKFVQGGVQRMQGDGVFIGSFQDWEQGVASLNPIFNDIGGRTLGGLMPAPANSSYIELDLAAGWAGVGNELSLYAFRPQAA